MAASHTAREAKCLLTYSHFFCRRKHGRMGSFLVLRCATWGEGWFSPWERGDLCKVNLFLLSSSKHLISETFAPTVYWLWDFHKCSVIHERISKSVFLEWWEQGGNGRKVLFCSLEDITLYGPFLDLGEVTRVCSVCENPSNVYLWFVHLSSLSHIWIKSTFILFPIVKVKAHSTWCSMPRLSHEGHCQPLISQLKFIYWSVLL